MIAIVSPQPFNPSICKDFLIICPSTHSYQYHSYQHIIHSTAEKFHHVRDGVFITGEIHGDSVGWCRPLEVRGVGGCVWMVEVAEGGECTAMILQHMTFVSLQVRHLQIKSAGAYGGKRVCPDIEELVAVRG